jgi:hypothetical protein
MKALEVQALAVLQQKKKLLFLPKIRIHGVHKGNLPIHHPSAFYSGANL